MHHTDLLAERGDFVEGPHIITIPPETVSGDVCTDLKSIIVDDAILESTETFIITIEGVSPCGDVGTANTTVVHITDNDGEWPCISLIMCQIMYTCVVQQN